MAVRLLILLLQRPTIRWAIHSVELATVFICLQDAVADAKAKAEAAVKRANQLAKAAADVSTTERLRCWGTARPGSNCFLQ